VTLHDFIVFVAGLAIGFVAGTIVEYLHKQAAAKAAGEAAEAKASAKASAAVAAIDAETKAVLDETAQLAGKSLQDAINADYSRPIVDSGASVHPPEPTPAASGEPTK
jgi:uncharacterized membrane protein YraQ (UPF0718 family)